MKTLKIAVVALGVAAISLSSCKEKKTETETLIEEAKENGADIKEKNTDDGYKLKVEDANGDETKIKVDENGEVKVKTDD
ncbi:PepSY domain-containing protein [Dokdonia sp. Hel_I_53]|uniref:PepSY domain-containing protein n=1 Tax=Dokdonia sp. Hel_I_53 TaxID=1566287 RepID=UPI0011993E4A|nr:PepSY domain-containing protein [Dokdonia sp. Hel_I_53]TVZ52967.1 YpeB-like protein with putative protease inhibitory function [Dokdonia sp. Hel_I_53]